MEHPSEIARCVRLIDMYATARQRSFLRGGVWIAIASAAAGAALSAGLGGADLSGLGRGALAGLAIALPVYVFDLLTSMTNWGRQLRRRPFLIVFMLRSVAYLGLIVLGLGLAALVMGRPIGGQAGFVTPVTVAFALVLASAFNFVWQLNRSLGQGALVSLVTGRYHRPRLEERVFLFLDLEGSTAAAERLGPERFLTLLDAISYDIADAVLEAGGEIHRYVGDEVIVTWPATVALRDAQCVQGCFAMLDAVSARASAYRRDYDFAPTFHAALHIGQVVIGEMGDLHREIVFLGDTVNTTARIEAASGPMGRAVLASADLVGRLTLPPGFDAEELGEIPLRGKREPIVLYALTRQSRLGSRS